MIGSRFLVPGAILVLLFSVPATGNDGHEFNCRRQANNPDGKLLTAEDVVYGKELSPKVIRDYFKANCIKAPKVFLDGSSLYLVKNSGDTVCVAEGGEGIVYGDIVSRHEFNTERGTFLSSDGKKLAFYRKDETLVPEFPLLDISAPGGKLNNIRYPMAGGPAEKVSVGVYDIENAATVWLDTKQDTYDGNYLTNITWNPSSDRIYVQHLDRAQQNMRLDCYDAADGSFQETLLTEHSDTWVEPQYPLAWIKGRNDLCIYSTDNRDGFWNLYLLDLKKKTVERLVRTDTDIQYIANDGRYVYFTGPDYHPVNNYLWRVDIRSRKVEQLTKEPGWHRIEMAPDCKSYLDVYECLDKAPVNYLKSVDGRKKQVLEDGGDPTADWAYSEIDMGTVTSPNGKDLNYYRLIKPLNFDPSKKYPLILYVYGGPHSQMVSNTFLGGLRRWEMYMAQKGYVVFVMDNRGTMRHGAEYEHSIYRQCGRKEMEDQMQAIDMLLEIPWIDRERVGVYGWSYGGFMSLTLATNHPEIFKVAVAGGPVIDWKWYEVMYGERYMGTPQSNPEGFAKTSLLNKAKDLKAKTLVIEGGNDDTVVPLHALSFLQACIDNGISVDYFTYPKAAHNMRGTDRVHLVNKINGYFFDNL